MGCKIRSSTEWIKIKCVIDHRSNRMAKFKRTYIIMYWRRFTFYLKEMRNFRIDKYCVIHTFIIFSLTSFTLSVVIYYDIVDSLFSPKIQYLFEFEKLIREFVSFTMPRSKYNSILFKIIFHFLFNIHRLHSTQKTYVRKCQLKKRAKSWSSTDSLMRSCD